jgi:hypothetical protein
MQRLRGDNYIRHATKPAWGLGKIIYADGADVWVYFKQKPGAVPEDRVARFVQSMDQLVIVTDVQDAELDNLPPYINGKFARKSTSLTFERAMALFQKAYPLGFGDPKYHDPMGERPYKLAAHHRFLDSEAALRDLAQAGTGQIIEQALRIIYFGDKNAETMALNLMHPR